VTSGLSLGLDFADIVAVLQDCFEGLYHGDSTRLRRVFHPRAVYACATGGTSLVMSMDEYFPIVDMRSAPASRGDTRTERIVSIEFVGPVTALAKLESAIEPKRVNELLTLIRPDGRWQVIARVFHYDVKAASG
jgi:hypothetical protein